MTFNELRAIFDSDDLNPNSEMVLRIDDTDYIVDDIGEDDDKIILYLRKKDDN